MPLGKQDFSASIRSSFTKLTSTAKSLNNATDELAKTGAAFDAALKKLNLGIEAWVDIATGEDGRRGLTLHDQVGYAKVNGKWGLALREIERDISTEDEEVKNLWLFADGPRNLRIVGIRKLPDLLLELDEDAQKTTNRINRTLEQTRELLESLQQSAELEAKK